MYYSVELLSARRRGKFAKCWFAATLNEKLFLKKFKSSSIRDTDLIAVCDEILRTICTATNRRAQRYSLYLSSQLMYGVAKIHYYQINIFQKELFELRIKLERVEITDGSPKKKRRLNLSEIEEYTVPEPLTLNLVFSDINEQDFHTLREDLGINAKLQNLVSTIICESMKSLRTAEYILYALHVFNSFGMI
ncbi:uncharacterized protein LOC107268411 [Cephus cinctus]|uniref:Uncharacterized protein LOC107268411 n=1 Tax=Cephus cinctus TaxID=211228 RepID=A0AAJ7FKQ7_CEPCN|nr:uncharacterized protein LOC107268411 [Cephus cinctus]